MKPTDTLENHPTQTLAEGDELKTDRELLDALKELRNECSGSPRPGRLLPLLAKADAAISRAEGRS